MGRVQDKVALITGGSGDIGAATARLLAREGATVVIADVNEEQGRRIAREIGCDFELLDVTSEAQWDEAIRRVDEKHGGIDVLVNGAGIEGDLLHGTPENTSFEEWRRVHAINLDGTFLGCRAVLPVMKRRGKGSIVNISSMAGLTATPNSTSYGSSKAGVMQLAKTIAIHGSRDGHQVRCNSIHPGSIRTQMMANILRDFGQVAGMSAEELEERIVSAIPLGRLGEPEDVANLILFLASDESSYITGSEFRIDAGWHLAGSN